MFTPGDQHRFTDCKTRHLLDLWISITAMQSGTWLGFGVTSIVLMARTVGRDTLKDASL